MCHLGIIAALSSMQNNDEKTDPSIEAPTPHPDYGIRMAWPPVRFTPATLVVNVIDVEATAD